MSEPAAGTTRQPAGDKAPADAGEPEEAPGFRKDGDLPPDAGERLSSASARLVDWYEAEARDLPWRRTDDPYAILVSEIMLQQTRVEAVVERYRAFLERFSDLRTLANADEEEVLAAWSGLGYYRRARFLHRAARRVVAEHAGELPRDRAGLRELPGIGDYTSAAVASIAFGAPALTVDGNVARVTARLLAVAADLRRAAPRRRLEEAMKEPLERHDPGTLNQALMELGARICLPSSPRCHRCPCADHCAALALGIQEQLPPGKKSRIEEVEEAAVVIEREGRFLLLRGQRPGVLADMWEFPTLDSRLRDEVAEGTDRNPGETDHLARDLRRHLARIGIDAHTGRQIGEIRHGITTRRIRCRVYRGTSEGPEEPPDGDDGLVQEIGWFSRQELEGLPIAASTRKILERIEDERTDPRLPLAEAD